ASQPHRVVRHSPGYLKPPLPIEEPAPVPGDPGGQGAGHSYVSNFKDFWVTDAAPVTVRGAAPGSHLTLNTGHGVVHATTDSTGQAVLKAPVPELVGTGTLTVIDRSGVHHFRHLHYAGGDVVQITPH